MKQWLVGLAACVFLVAGEAHAKRMGGGSSIGKQSSRVTQVQKAPAQQAAGATAPKPAASPTPGKSMLGGMLGGLAAGLGLAWLANSLGFGEEFGQILMVMLLVFGVFMLIRLFARRSQQGYAYQGAQDVGTPASYRADKVGNDASARPWENSSTRFESAVATPAGGSMIGSAIGGAQTWGVPDDFDTPAFLSAAKANFVSLQAAWDRADIGALRAMMTDAMLKEIQAQLAERDAHSGGQTNSTEVVDIEARLLGIEDLGDEYLASVEFSGMIREEPGVAPSPFREVWNMSKTKAGASGWLVAGVQALQ